MLKKYRSGTVNSKFHLIRSYCEIFSYHFPAISCLKCTVNSNFHLIRSKTLLTNDFELTVPNLYYYYIRLFVSNSFLDLVTNVLKNHCNYVCQVTSLVQLTR